MAMWMALALRMDHLESTSGALQGLTVKSVAIQMDCAHVITGIPILLNLHRSLGITTIANQVIQLRIGKIFQMTNYGMENSVVAKVHAALAPIPYHSSP